MGYEFDASGLAPMMPGLNTGTALGLPGLTDWLGERAKDMKLPGMPATPFDQTENKRVRTKADGSGHEVEVFDKKTGAPKRVEPLSNDNVKDLFPGGWNGYSEWVKRGQQNKRADRQLSGMEAYQQSQLKLQERGQATQREIGLGQIDAQNTATTSQYNLGVIQAQTQKDIQDSRNTLEKALSDNSIALGDRKLAVERYIAERSDALGQGQLRLQERDSERNYSLRQENAEDQRNLARSTLRSNYISLIGQGAALLAGSA
jgi:hypothetical protein